MQKLIGILVLIGLAGTGEAFAQACVGSPAANREYALGLSTGMSPGYAGYGATFVANVPGGLFTNASYSVNTFDEFDDDGNTVSIGAGYEIPVSSISACPHFSVAYETLNTITPVVNQWGSVVGVATEFRALVIPVGIGVGRRWDFEEGLFVAPAVTASFVHVRRSVEAPELGGEFDESLNEIGAGTSVAVGWNQFFVRGGMSGSTVEDSDLFFSLGIGLVLR